MRPAHRTSATSARPKVLSAYVGIVCLVGVAALMLLAKGADFGRAADSPFLLFALTLAVIAGELKPLRIPRGNSGPELITTSTTFAYAIVLGWGPMLGVASILAACLVLGAAHRRPWWKTAFNIGQYTLSFTAAAAVVGLLVPHLGPGGTGQLRPSDLSAVLLGGMAFFIANNALVSTALALASNRKIIEVNLEDFGFHAICAGGLVALAPIVLVLVRWSVFMVPLQLLPILAVYRGGRSTPDSAPTEDRFRAMAENAADLVVIVDAEAVFRYVSPSVEAILGYRPDVLVGTSLFELVHRDELPKAHALLSDLLANSGKVLSTEITGRHLDGSWRHLEVVCKNVLEDSSVRGIVVNGRDVTERKVLEQELSHQAFHDQLTGLANRGLFRDHVEHALARSARNDGAIAVLFLDLDDFKMINDSLGHATGDEVLVEAARRLKERLRAGDTAARLGGDEFAVLLEGIDGPEASMVARRILEGLTPAFFAGRQEIMVRGSLGIALAHSAGESADELLRNADVAMYAAKGRGKARFELFEPEMRTAALERLELEAELQHAIERDQLFTHYQPIVSLQSGRIVGVEALVRWRHPRRGIVSPAGFIPLAEETGLIVQLGQQVLARACRDAASWMAAAPEEVISISVNISARQLGRADFVDAVAFVLEQTGIPADRLVLEITESTLMRDAEECLFRLHQLKRLGVQIALDDFGTGYSSLSHLRRFPVDILKIDRSFVEGVTNSADDSALARAVVQIGRTLHLVTVAEGIERAEQLQRLRSIGCDLGQGFFISRPVTPKEIGSMLAEARTAGLVAAGAGRGQGGARSL